jgi:hypothetical protein
VEDGATALRHADWLLAEIGTANAVTYPLTDAPGSMTGTAAFDVFGAIRSQTGVTSAVRFTGAPRDEAR